MSNDVGVVWWIVSKVGSDSETVIQVVIADDGGGENAKAVAYVTKQLLEDGIIVDSFLLFVADRSTKAHTDYCCIMRGRI